MISILNVPPLLSFSIQHTTSPIPPDLSAPPLSHLVCSHLALGALVRLRALTERSLNGFHLCGYGLEGLLIVLLSLESLVQTLLLLTYL